MQCPACRAENPEQAFFCGECGAQLRSALGQPVGPVSLHGDAPDPLATAVPGGLPPMPPPLGPIAPAQLGTEAPSLLDTPIGPEATTPVAPVAGETTAELPKPPGFPCEIGIHGQPPIGGAVVEPTPPGFPPPPAPPGYAQQAPPPAYQAPPQYQAQQYLPPQQQYTPGQAYLPPAAPPPPGYGYSLPPDGNTSGMGEGYPLPPGVSGFTAGGCIPFGLFGFINGSTLWGIIGLVGHLIGPASLVYAIYIAIQGRELAWRNRRFDSLAQFQDSMHPWNLWGFGCLGLSIAAVVLYFVFIFAMVGTGMFEEFK